ncbi:MAG: serine/threonine protein kinase/tetratricopeptide (TPR) repeat protein [Cognaticolwellia sp.]|jgi:serine/threonine protein kinase/tetratricopeptide (TPR) repeat protein
MGVVWAAQHRARGKEVAIKLLHEGSLRDDWALESFQKEVRAQAGLSHAGIVTVLDHGVVDNKTPGLPAGAPYLVMEIIDGVQLHGYTARMSWSRLRDVLFQLLDALSHSHARGVIHRDLKPGNVIVLRNQGQIATPTGQDPFRVTLTDFGLAQAVDRGSPADAVVAGTPAYMAPEQLDGLWRDQGPWTDLYALGCLAWGLATGDPPFGRQKQVAEFRDLHLRAKPPAFKPAHPVPEGFEGWLRRLLEKRPDNRFNRAAEASFALLGLEGGLRRGTQNAYGELLRRESPTIVPELGPSPILSGQSHSLPNDQAALEALMTQAIDALDEATGLLPLNAIEPMTMESEPLPRVRVPMPATWQHPRPPARPEPLPGVGLNLVAIREAEVVGRAAERDALWAALSQVHGELSQRAVILAGPAGCGRTRLGSWLAERADEVGAATVLSASHIRGGGALDGVTGMLARHLRSEGLTADELKDRLRPWRELAAPIAELVHPTGEVVFASPKERHGVVLRFLERLSRPLGPDQKAVPVILVLDDAHWSADALAFAQMVLNSTRSIPVLLVITTQDEALGELPAARGALSALARSSKTTHIRVEALEPVAHRRLLQEMLGMDQALVGAIAERTAGNPKFAIQLIEDWAERNLLEAASGGFRLRRGVSMDLPRDLQTVWQERVQRVLAESSGMASQALEIAAVLGDGVSIDEWKQVCEQARIPLPPGLLSRLSERRLIQSSEEHFRFSNAMLREALLNQARQAKRSPGWHQACAAVLMRRPDHGVGVSERLGRHLLLSGQAEPAFEVLLEGGKRAIDRAELESAHRQLQARERAMKRLRIPANDPRWGHGWLTHAFLLFFARRYPAGEKWLARAEDGARLHGWRHVRAHALRERSRFERRAQDLPAAAKALRAALSLAPDDDELAASSRLGLGAVLLLQGKVDQAKALLEEAHQSYQWSGSATGMADCEINLARCAIQQGRLTQAQEHVETAQGLFEQASSSWKAAECLNMFGEISRAQGDLSRAETLYQQAAQRLEEVGHPDPYWPRVNLGLVLAARGEHARARALLVPNLRVLEHGRSPMMAATVHLALLTPTAAMGEWQQWDSHLQAAERMLESSGFVDLENANQAQCAGRAALEMGKFTRAREALHIALKQWKALSREDKVGDVRELLTDMGE